MKRFISLERQESNSGLQGRHTHRVSAPASCPLDTNYGITIECHSRKTRIKKVSLEIPILVFFRIFRIPFRFFVRLQSLCCAHELVITLNELNTQVGSWG